MDIYYSILTNINSGDYISTFSKKSNITFSHCVKLIQRLEKDKLIKTELIGRTRIIKITEKGERIKTLFLEIKEEMSHVK